MAEEVVEQITEQIKPEPQLEEQIAAGGNAWNGDQEKWENRTPREDQGSRFAKIRENLAKANRKTEFLKALQMGAIDPMDESLDADTFAAARNAQIARGTNKISPPEFHDEQTGDGAEGGENAVAEQPLTPEQIKHNEAHEEMHTRLLARLEAPEVKKLTTAMEYAVQRGATPYFFDTLGHLAADFDNREQVLFHLGENPEKLTSYSLLSPERLKSVIRALSQQLGAKATAPPKPKPPDPVGARASSSAFDVYDDSIDADTWARQRNEQLSKRARR
jgi:hypothetical protein